MLTLTRDATGGLITPFELAARRRQRWLAEHNGGRESDYVAESYSWVVKEDPASYEQHQRLMAYEISDPDPARRERRLLGGPEELAAFADLDQVDRMSAVRQATEEPAVGQFGQDVNGAVRRAMARTPGLGYEEALTAVAREQHGLVDAYVAVPSYTDLELPETQTPAGERQGSYPVSEPPYDANTRRLLARRETPTDEDIAATIDALGKAGFFPSRSEVKNIWQHLSRAGYQIVKA